MTNRRALRFARRFYRETVRPAPNIAAASLQKARRGDGCWWIFYRVLACPELPSFPATCAPGTCFQNQCAHWWKKQSLQEVEPPGNSAEFQVRAVFSIHIEKPQSGFSMPD